MYRWQKQITCQSLPLPYVSSSETCSPLVCFVLTLILSLLLTGPLVAAQTASLVRQQSVDMKKASRPPDARTLIVGRPIEREMKGGEIHSYNLNLHPGQFIHLIVDQRGIDVSVTLYGSDEDKLMTINLFGVLGPEPLSYVADKKATYRLEVRSLAPASASGRYEINSDVRPAAMQQDKDRLVAERLLAEARELEEKDPKEFMPAIIEKREQALTLWRSLADSFWEAYTLTNLGSAYQAFGESQRALDFYNQSLLLKRAIGDRNGEALTLNAMGNLYYFTFGENQKALDFYTQALALKKAIGDRRGEASTLVGIGRVNLSLDDKPKALESFNQALAIYHEVKAREGEALTFSYLMKLWKMMNKPSLAIFYGKQAINIYQELRGNIRGLDKELRKGYLKTKSDTYRILADMLVSEGRLDEARQILDLLKEEEYFELNPGSNS